MSDPLLTLNHVTKLYGRQKAVNDISYSFCSNEIYGIVGENGAGKTTLIRLLAKLIKPSSGKLTFSPKIKMSCIVESPSLYQNMTAFENLKYQAIACGVKDVHNKIKEVLNLVGLENVDMRKKLHDFSLGMKQRLAIGLAIIDDPNVLILDEPINGLDPLGIKDMRQIILTLKMKYNMTILVSSHILSELDLVADRFLIMHGGNLIADISDEDLQKQLSAQIQIITPDYQKCMEVLNEKNIKGSISGDEIIIESDRYTITGLIDLLRSQRIEINGIYQRNVTFEEYYLELLKEMKEKGQYDESFKK